MSAKLQSKQKDRLNQSYLDSLIEYKEQNFEEQIPRKPKPILHSEEEFDTLHPEEVLKSFGVAVRAMMTRYEMDREELSRLEAEMQDLLHFMEMTGNKNAREGYRIYRKLSEVRRQRRACKNEIDLLYPVYEMFHGTDMLNKLGHVQGQCRKLKETICNKNYSVRTDILADLIEKEVGNG